jgi:hypothetical protein
MELKRKMTEQKVNLKKIETGVVKLKVVGRSPYLPEPMDEAVLERYDAKKSKRNYSKDDISEEEKAKEKYYYTNKGEKGVPARAFYNAMWRASSYLIDKKDGGMRKVKEGVIVKGDILPLQYSKEEKVIHWGRTSGQSGSPRKIIRNAFYDWSTTVEIEFNKNQLSAEQIVNILNWAGFHIGVGGFRKEKTGNYGLFTVDFE